MKEKPIVKAPPKVRITINLDESVIEFFKAQAGETGSYQLMINKALKEHIANQKGKKDV